MGHRDDTMLSIFFLILVIIIVVGITAVGYSSDDDALKAIRSHGFTDIEIKGWAPLECSEDDTTSQKFTARNPRGERVEGVVCCGVFKSCTVRF